MRPTLYRFVDALESLAWAKREHATECDSDRAVIAKAEQEVQTAFDAAVRSTNVPNEIRDRVDPDDNPLV